MSWDAAGRGEVSAERRSAFATVGMGASAGGLKALQAFLAAMPPAPEVAIVIVTHQHPDHASLLPELLAKHTHLAVTAARDGLDLEGNHVYVCPPGKDVLMAGGRLELVNSTRGTALHLPIDRFLRSLAQDQEERAICIVLSGTGTDGTLGLRAIKRHGGMAIVQDRESASYPGMPLSAAGSGLADFVLPPGEMPAKILAFARRLGPPRAAWSEDGIFSEALGELFRLLRERTGHDFRNYKLTAMRRQVERRMRVHDIAEPRAYLRFLESNPHETELLFSELLINVTRFFRDPEVFERLDAVLSERLAQGRSKPGFRVWVVGCSTGEEACSIGMLLSEIATRSGRPLQPQIFATDLDQNAIDQARSGLYAQGVAADVGPARLARFFVPHLGGYRMGKEIRELIVFANQNVLKDPPFTKLDILSCRNLLIYLDPELQRRLILMFHYALEPGGILLLGSSETIGEFEHLFKPIDRKLRIYEREAAVARAPSIDWLGPREQAAPVPRAPLRAPAPSGVAKTLEKLLLERFAPPTVIVSQSGEIAYIHGRTGNYLEPTTGQPRNNLLLMAREGLQPGLSNALRLASAEGREILQHDLSVRNNGGHTPTTLVVQRLQEPESVRGLFRVSFHATAEGTAKKSAPSRARALRRPEVEEQLEQTRLALKTANEELQTSNEELRSMNEELQSTNEELQSINEEVETSREELHALNTELQSTNLELHVKMGDLARANDDMTNLLNSTEIATLFVDRDLTIQRFTDPAREVIHLIPSDVGRPIGDLVSYLRHSGLTEHAQRVLETLNPYEAEVQTTQGGWRLLRMLPYRTADNAINGVVITLIDIDRVKNAERLAASRALAERIVQTVREPLAVLDDDFLVVSANPAFMRRFAGNDAPPDPRPLFEFGAGAFAEPALRSALEALRARGTPVEGQEIIHDIPGQGRRRLLLNACRLIGLPEVTNHLLVTLAHADRSGTAQASM